MNKVLHVTSVGKELLKDLEDKVLQELNRDKPIAQLKADASSYIHIEAIVDNFKRSLMDTISSLIKLEKEILKNKEEHEFVITTFPEQNQKVVRADSEEAMIHYKKLIANMIMSNFISDTSITIDGKAAILVQSFKLEVFESMICRVVNPFNNASDSRDTVQSILKYITTLTENIRDAIACMVSMVSNVYCTWITQGVNKDWAHNTSVSPVTYRMLVNYIHEMGIDYDYTLISYDFITNTVSNAVNVQHEDITSKMIFKYCVKDYRGVNDVFVLDKYIPEELMQPIKDFYDNNRKEINEKIKMGNSVQVIQNIGGRLND